MGICVRVDRRRSSTRLTRSKHWGNISPVRKWTRQLLPLCLVEKKRKRKKKGRIEVPTSPVSSIWPVFPQGAQLAGSPLHANGAATMAVPHRYILQSAQHHGWKCHTHHCAELLGC